MISTHSTGAEFHLEPTLTVSEEYNDNILLREEDPVDEYITRIIMGLQMDYASNRLTLDVLYAPEYRYFANYDDYPEEGVRDEVVHSLDASGRFNVIENLFFMEASDVYERISLDITRDFTRESLFVNQTDRNTFTLNPYFRISGTAPLTMEYGYRYVDVWYESDEGIDRYDNIAYVDLLFEALPTVTLETGYQYMYEVVDNEDVPNADDRDFEKQDIYIGGRYEYHEGSSLSLRVGYSDIYFRSGAHYDYIFWDAALLQRVSSLFVLFETGRDFSDNPTGYPLRKDRYGISLRNAISPELPENPEEFLPAKDEESREISFAPSRAAFNIALYQNEYTDTFTEELDTLTYGGTGWLSYLFSQNIIGNVAFTAEREEDKVFDTYTRLYLAGVGVTYLPFRDIRFELKYSYSHSYSPDIVDDRYENNRVIASIKKTF